MAQETGQISEEEEFEFRHRMEMESGQASLDQPKKSAPPGFFGEHPILQKSLQIGIPLAAGVATMPFTGGMSLPAILALEGGVQAGTEGILQGLGVNEQDPKSIGLAAAAPGIGRSLGGVLANIPRLLPGYSSAVGASMADDIRNLPGKLLGNGNVNAAYQAVNQGNTAFRMTSFPELSKTVQKLSTQADAIPLDKLASDVRAAGMSDLYEQIQTVLKGAPAKMTMQSPTVGKKALNTGLPKQMVQTAPARPPGLTFEEARAMTEGFGAMIRNTSDPKLRGQYQQLYKATLKDMENHAQGGAPFKEWQIARETAKREYAKSSLLEQTEKAIATKDGVDIFDPNKVVRWLRTSDEIKSRVSSGEYRAIVNEYRMLASMKGHDLSKLVATLVGGFTGGSGGAAAAYIGSEQLAKAMMTEGGRKAVRAMATNPSESNFRRFFTLMGIGGQAALPDGQGE